MKLEATYTESEGLVIHMNMCNDGGAVAKYIESEGHVYLWKLYEIPLYGGEPQFYGSYDSFKDLYETVERWT